VNSNINKEPADSPAISIIIPVLDEAQILAHALAGLPRSPDVEIIVVDGGSVDGSPEIVARFPDIHRLTAPQGRGAQMNAGARLAQGEFLLFLHIDTAITAAHVAALRRAAQDPKVRAGAFFMRLTPATPFLRFIAWGANWRCRLFGVPYGDQAIFVRRDLFFDLQGYARRRPEDLDLVLRLRRYTRLRLLNPPVITSGRRWLARGNLKTTALYWLELVRHRAERLFTRRWPLQGDL
jgi:rSAM/selenodomain-associated transferase 2